MNEEAKREAWFIFHLILWFTIIPLLTMHFVVAPMVAQSWQPNEYHTIFDWNECMADNEFEVVSANFNNKCDEMLVIYLVVEDFQGRDLYSIQPIPTENDELLSDYRGSRGGLLPANETFQATVYRGNETIEFDFFLNESYSTIIIYESEVWQYTKGIEKFTDGNTNWWDTTWEYRLLLWRGYP